jgi:NTE family protein
MPSRTASHPVGRNERCGRIALVLQGGGALGAYQAGVYQALQEAGLEPDWVSGVSIGAINGAIIAGNPPALRLQRLRTFWERITERKIWNYTPDGDVFRRTRNAASSWLTILHGQPSPWLSFPGARTATSYYDSAPLRETLLELVDFSLINQKETRLAVGAVNVLDGNFAYFDNALDTIEPAHVMASGALPRDIQDVMARHKDIVYSSRTRYNTDVYRRIHTWKTRLRDALQKVPADRLTDEERRLKDELADLPEIAILQLIYQQKSYEGHAKDYEFSGTSMREHWTSGYEDTMRTLKHRHWIAMPREGDGIVVHDVHREE